jgi:hypothetical protein
MEFSPQLKAALKRAKWKEQIKKIAAGLGAIITLWIASRIWFNLSFKDQFDWLVVVVAINAIVTIFPLADGPP